MHPEIKEKVDLMPEKFQPDAAGDMDAVLQFELSGDKEGNFNVAIKDGSCTVNEGKADNPNTTFKLAGQDWLDLTEGKADGMSLFMQGKLQVEGDMGIAMRLQSLFAQ